MIVLTIVALTFISKEEEEQAEEKRKGRKIYIR